MLNIRKKTDDDSNMDLNCCWCTGSLVCCVFASDGWTL